MSELILPDRILTLFPKTGKQILEIFHLSKVIEYSNFLRDYNEIGGFFSKSDSEFFLDRHVIESMFHIFVINSSGYIKASDEVADVGTGPGLPGYLFSCLQNSPKVTLIDSQSRRLSLLEKFYKEQNYDSKVSFLYDRMEGIKKQFDLVVMRSAIRYPWSCEMVYKILKQNSYFIPFLAKRVYDTNFEKTLLQNLGMIIEKDLDLNELEFLGNRHIKILKKEANPNKGFPRNWESISKEIKRISWEK
ncbi:MAG TPA: class I SAM-dependent methyltransferase [Leptospiraceae bacterium]|nr:class I SAM-dependent methyltransferase [Leptospiraceae bacterium]HMW04569.1 class I SAM-dependent methyltransferase [Leptospiraceae bacterium]HMX33278.1 class I SAM-dependent methyltransferase [Leptospiraceae bacterium]HMY30755.1 class I SAM-dependent methyltransferase [Leptospiraceae bacterium]HMZ64333.1 class I SAM-dependent methyltransferase [Leptospiraceae bacterium]